MKALHTFLLSLAVSLMTFGMAAQAALPAGVATTITGISDDMQDLFDLVFPVVAIALGLTVVIKLFKRFGNKI